MKRQIKKFLSIITGFKLIRNKFISPVSVKKVLVISLYFRGDLLFHSTFLKAFKVLFPHSKIDLWIKTRLNDIVNNNPVINKIHLFDDVKTAEYNDKSEFNLKQKFSFIKNLKNEKYDLIIDLTGKYSTAFITLLAKPKYSIGINYNYFGFCYDKFVYLNTSTEEGHLIEKYLNVLKYGLNIDNERWIKLLSEIQIKPYIYIDKTDSEAADSILQNNIIFPGNKIIIIHVTSGWKAKELPVSVFADLIDKLLTVNYNIFFIGDDKDRDRLHEIQKFMKTKDIVLTDLFRTLPFLQSAALIKSADIFIGSDSAPLHVAGAVGTPSIGLFGPTNPEFSRPIGKQHRVIYHQLHCSSAKDRQYCTLNGGFNCPTWDCMQMITPDEILIVIEDLLNTEYESI